ncbi:MULTISPECIES: DMT family transporter [Gammaproteobacteria]|uniref:DMT family transporter n=1 Tax=Gammaproteobacteria TaxID=1236 RepID=UPI000DD0D9FA|nr:MULTISPECIES: DMT family transporter [Gammaproteobacteria]RTE86927.1 DMT family transporter [Aliidiomarina sp. B3213]TCZ93283.1 DMT family transporter [Lysobacter sp. N42]
MHKDSIGRGIVFMILAIFCFAIMDVCMKHLAGHLSTFQVSFFRGFMSLPFILIWLASRKTLHRMKPNRIGLHILRGIISIAFLVLTVTSLRELPLANAYAIFFIAPLIITLLSVPLLKEKVGIHRYGAVAVGFVGVLIMLNPSAMGFASVGVITGLLATFGYASVMIMVRIMHRTETSESLMVMFVLSLSVGCGLLSIANWQPVTWTDVPWLFMLGFSGAIAQYLLTEAYRQAPPSVLSPFEYTAMIWAIGLGYLLWGELPTTAVVIGALIVIASGIYISHRETRKKATHTATTGH